MADPLAAAIAFAALGANVLATALFLLFNPRSGPVRWFSVFLTAISVWLLAAGMLAISGDPGDPWKVPFAGAVMIMPVLFAASTLAQVRSSPRWLPWAVTAAGVLLLPLAVGAMLGTVGLGRGFVVAWHVAGWGGGVVVDRTLGSARKRPRDPVWLRRLVDSLLLIPPAAVVGGIVLGAQAFFLYAMPLIVIGLHLALFVGVVWLRFYDIEVRAARSGELATGFAEADRLAAVGELAASVAHEVRNPLTGIRSLAQRMASEDLDAERWRRYSAVIVTEVDRVDRIVGNLLSLARREPAHGWSGRPTPLEPLFQDLALLTAARAQRAGVRVDVDAGDTVAPAPREALAQALLNLLLNAIRHSPAGGEVRMTARPGDPVEIRVRDQGPGVPAAERASIFEPFHTGSAGGTGLGLSVVRRLARELAWELSVDDAPDGGAVFRIRILATAPRARQGPPRPIAAGDRAGGP
jgi:signal transduction histidine kinase